MQQVGFSGLSVAAVYFVSWPWQLMWIRHTLNFTRVALFLPSHKSASHGTPDRGRTLKSVTGHPCGPLCRRGVRLPSLSSLSAPVPDTDITAVGRVILSGWECQMQFALMEGTVNQSHKGRNIALFLVDSSRFGPTKPRDPRTLGTTSQSPGLVLKLISAFPP